MIRFAVAALFALSATAALADDITLAKPEAGATLHDAGIDMSVYWTPAAEGAGYEVVATYLTATDAEPSRIAMVLNDGDRVSFGLPGARGVIYSFAREGAAVTVTGTRLGTDLAEG